MDKVRGVNTVSLGQHFPTNEMCSLSGGSLSTNLAFWNRGYVFFLCQNP